MKTKTRGFLLAVAVATMAFTFSCSSDDGDDNTWSNVTSLSQVNGTWKAQPTVTKSGNGVTMTVNYTDYIITFDTAAGTMTSSGTATSKVSGISSAQWQELKVSMGYMKQMMGECLTINANDADYSFAEIHNNCSQHLQVATLTQMNAEINQDGTQLKFLMSGIEVVYTKISGPLSKPHISNINIAEASPSEVSHLMAGGVLVTINKSRF